MPQRPRSTPAGQHRAVMLDDVLAVLDPQPGQVVVDCTVGWGGHAVELLRRVGSSGRLIGIDLDADNLPVARQRLGEVGFPFTLHHANFAGLAAILDSEGSPRVDALVADLGMSSMQVDDPERGFSYRRDGVLDMRMDRSRGRTASQILAATAQEELARVLKELGDEPEADRIAAAIVRERQETPLERTAQLVQVIQQATGSGSWRLHPSSGKWNLHPAARTFQALRMLVNRELGNLGSLLRLLPDCLNKGGRAAIISFHSGEDRMVKAAFRDGARADLYENALREPVRASGAERQRNPRSRSAKLRWVKRR